MARKIIGLAGLAQSGKSSCGGFLKNAGYYELSFADTLKTSAMHVFGLSHDDVFTNNGKRRFVPEVGKTVREILQLYGTEVARMISPNVWVNAVEKKIHDTKHDKLVITDVRFINELQMIKRHGGIVVKVARDDYRELTGSGDDHESEQLANQPDSYFDAAIHARSGEMDKLKQKIIEIASDYDGVTKY